MQVLLFLHAAACWPVSSHRHNCDGSHIYITYHPAYVGVVISLTEVDVWKWANPLVLGLGNHSHVFCPIDLQPGTEQGLLQGAILRGARKEKIFVPRFSSLSPLAARPLISRVRIENIPNLTKSS